MPIPVLRSHQVLRRTLHVTCLGVLFATPAQLRGQSLPRVRLSLQQAVEAARSASPDLTVARHAVTAAEARARQAGAWPNPVLSYGREQTSASGESSAQDIVAVEQRLELGAVRSARVEAYRARHDAAVARLQAIRAELDYETTRSYALAVAADRRLALASQAAGAFARAVGVSGRRLAAGDVSGFSHRRMQLEAARYATIRAEAHLAHRTAMTALATLVSGTPEAIATAVFELADSLPSAVATATDPEPMRALFALSVDALIRYALGSRGDLRALELDAMAMRAEARLVSATRVPSPAFSLGLKRDRLPGTSQPSSGFVAGVSIPVAIWDRKQGAVAAATADAAGALAGADGLRRRIVREVAAASEAWRALDEPLAALQPHLGDAALRAIQAVQVAFDEGEVTLLEWLDAVRAYQEAESGFIALRAEVMIRRAAFARAVGAPVMTADRGLDAPARN